MGIQGLLPLLKSSSRSANISEFRGCTVAIDSYCWLHKGAFACAEKLAMGEPTDQYVFYCLKYINGLLAAGIKPVMVFDGGRLPSKKEVEKQRRERRETYRKKAAHLLREGKRMEARDCLSKCVDITSQMALELMNACRDKGVDCIVAPYEADAQLAYLNKIGVAQIIITEDSDLILFGCERIMFKMDMNGNGVLIEKNDLSKAIKLRPDLYSFDKFRYMCIMSGCDYLPSLPGIGLGKAGKVFQLTRQTDMTQVLKKMPSLLKMASLEVSSEYIDGFYRADNTFLYQLVYDPLHRKLVPLNPYPPDLDRADLDYAGPYLSDDVAYQLALGNIDVHTHAKMADFDPDTHRPRASGWHDNDRDRLPHQLSIWNPQYRPMSADAYETLRAKKVDPTPSNTRGKEIVARIPQPVRRQHSNDVIIVRRDSGDNGVECDDDISEADLDALYGGASSQQPPASKKPRVEFFDSQSFFQFDSFDTLTAASSQQSLTTQSQSLSDCASQPAATNDWDTVANNYGSYSNEEENDVIVCEPDDRPATQQSTSADDGDDLAALVAAAKQNAEETKEATQVVQCEESGVDTVLESPPTNKKLSRNKFAVSSAKNKPQFSLNISPKGEVKSRFFMTQKPLKKTEFFKEMSDESYSKQNVSVNADKVKDKDDGEVLSQPRAAINGDFKPVRPSSSVLSDLRISRLSNVDNTSTSAATATAASDGQASKARAGAFRLFEFKKRTSVESVVQQQQPSDATSSQSQDYSDIENESAAPFRFHSDVVDVSTPADGGAAESVSAHCSALDVSVSPQPILRSVSAANVNSTLAASLKNKGCQPTGLRKPSKSLPHSVKSKGAKQSNNESNKGQPTISSILSQFQYSRVSK